MIIANIKSVLSKTDWLIIIISTLLTISGILFVYSSGINASGVLVSDEYLKQIFWAIISFLLLISFLLVKQKLVFEYSFIIYVFFIILLFYTLVFGRVVNGSRSWIGVGSFGIQPSEFAKISTIIFLSKYLSSTIHEAGSFRRFVISGLIVLLPFILIAMQPDFGTAIVFIPLYLFIAFFLKINLKYLYFLVGLAATIILFILLPLWQNLALEKPIDILRIFYETPFVIYVYILGTVIMLLSLLGYFYFKKKYYFWIFSSAVIFIIGLGVANLISGLLKDYQMMRLIVFFDPHIDEHGSGWHILQSLTAIGSGGLTGKGFLLGTHSHYRYLPTQSTDFIFSIISEELGFLGAGIIIFAYFILVIRLFIIMNRTRDYFSLGMVSGISGLLVFHFVVNVGMTIGIMPITGIPLWFLSYGGSALVAINIGLGCALSAGARRFEIERN